MCGKGVGLGFFPPDSLESQSYEFDDENAHIKPLYGVERLLKVLSNRELFLRKSKGTWLVFSRRFSKKNADYSSDFFFFKTNELTDFINFISWH